VQFLPTPRRMPEKQETVTLVPILGLEPHRMQHTWPVNRRPPSAPAKPDACLVWGCPAVRWAARGSVTLRFRPVSVS
jgi:hypothetical protein